MRKKAKSPIEKYKNWIGMGLVLVVFIVVLVIAGKPKSTKSGSTKSKKSSSEEIEKAPRQRKRKSKADKVAERAARRLERARRREEKMKGESASRERKTRRERSTERSRIGSRVQTEAGYVLKGIFTDEKGERYALIGDRRARSGDLVAGRKIRQVESDRVEVEYGGSNYEVRVGNALF